MQFSPLSATELGEIRRLNLLFLSTLQRRLRSGHGIASLSPGQAAWLASAGPESLLPLARAPYFLFDLSRVARTGERSANGSLFAADEGPESSLLLMALCFAWQLSRRSRFAVRVVTGATEGWCDWIGAVPYADLAECAGHSAPVIPVLADLDVFWPALVEATRQQRILQVGAIHSAGLQHLLSRQGDTRRQYRLAANRLRAPRRQVAEQE